MFFAQGMERPIVFQLLLDNRQITYGRLSYRYFDDCTARIVLSGSRAKGDYHDRSDIDIGLISNQSLPAGFISIYREKVD